MKTSKLRKCLCVCLTILMIVGCVTVSADQNAENPDSMIIPQLTEETLETPETQDSQLAEDREELEDEQDVEEPEEPEKPMEEEIDYDEKVGTIYSSAKRNDYVADMNNYQVISMTEQGQIINLNFESTKAGQLFIHKIVSDDNIGNVEIQLINKENGNTTNLFTKNPECARIAVKDDTQYQIKITDISTEQVTKEQYALASYIIPTLEDRNYISTYTEGNASLGAGKNGSGETVTTYWKQYVPKKGRMIVYAWGIDSDANVEIALFDSKMNRVSVVMDMEGKKGACFGVGGDRNYYVRITTDAPVYATKTTLTPYGFTPGASKSKAKSIDKGTYKLCTMPASTAKPSQWFKIYNNKKKSVKIDLEGYVSPGAKIKMTLLNKSGDVLETVTIKGAVGKVKTAYIKTSSGDKLAKGTYYIKIQKYSDKGSAAYKLKYTY